MKRFALTLAAAILAVSARAQTPNGDAEMFKSLGGVKDTVEALSAQAVDPQKLLRSALDGMACQGADDAVGPRVSEYLRGGNVRIDFTSTGPKVATGFGVVKEGSESKRIEFVFLADSLGKTNLRYLSIFLADGASRLMDQDFPESAEKEYMRLSRMSRAWLELGGERAKLPDFDGVKDEATSDLLHVWIENGDVGSVAKLVKKPTLDAQISANAERQGNMRMSIERGDRLADPAALQYLRTELARLSAAKSEFKAFKDRELGWFQTQKPF